MGKKWKILESREKFDKSLCSPDLMSQKTIKSLVEKQLSRSTFSGSQGELEAVVQKRAPDVSNFLDMLRSTSELDRASLEFNSSSQTDWKLKQETDQLRVMYREGPAGTPFHTLLAEGYADGPVDSCLCVSWESTLYKNWWPQYNIPTFKIILSSSLQKIRIGEEISLVRVKPPWPVSEREAILHNFELEFFEEDLVLVLINTISSSEHLEMSSHGFTRDGIPDAKGTVRIDMVGGFAIQKVSPNRSYFRAIANLDIKLEFVPPALINFISRQLLANGHKLYQKAVAAVASGAEEYREALKGPMYARIREFLYSSRKPKEVAGVFTDENCTARKCANEEILHDMAGSTRRLEIEEEKGVVQKNVSMEEQWMRVSTLPYDGKSHPRKGKGCVSPEVERALVILDKAVVIFRDLQASERCSEVSRPSTELEVSYMVQEGDYPRNEDSAGKRVGAVGDSDLEGGQVIERIRRRGVQVVSAALKSAGPDKEARLQERRLPPTVEEDDAVDEAKERQGAGSSGEKQPSALERMSRVFDEEVSINADGTTATTTRGGGGVQERRRGSSTKQKKKRKYMACCVGC